MPWDLVVLVAFGLATFAWDYSSAVRGTAQGAVPWAGPAPATPTAGPAHRA